MTRIAGLLRFLWDFVVGDDWRIALGVVLALVATALISNTGVTIWWLLPAAVAVLLSLSVYEAARRRR